MKIGTCFLCSSNNLNYGTCVCCSCKLKYTSELIAVCPRCGGSNCIGACDLLTEFDYVESIWTLENSAATLLLKAKTHSCRFSQLIFKEIYFNDFCERLHQVIKTKQTKTVVLPLVKIRKNLAGFWHPTFLFLRALKTLQKRVNCTEKINILSPFSISFRELDMAQINLKNRLLGASKKLYWKESRYSKETSTVLFLDDVLTSGSSISRLKSCLPKEYSNSEFLVLTLFRTPVKTISSLEHLSEFGEKNLTQEF